MVKRNYSLQSEIDLVTTSPFPEMVADNSSPRPGNISLSSDSVNNSLLNTDAAVKNFSLPPDMVFGEAQVIAIVAYSILFFVGVTINTASLR
jgi:hypothetical protein